MWPVIFDFGTFNLFGREIHIAIYSYGFMLVVAFYTCFFLLQKEIRRIGKDVKLASDIVFIAAVGGIVGSKIYFLIENFVFCLFDFKWGIDCYHITDPKGYICFLN